MRDVVGDRPATPPAPTSPCKPRPTPASPTSASTASAAAKQAQLELKSAEAALDATLGAMLRNNGSDSSLIGQVVAQHRAAAEKRATTERRSIRKLATQAGNMLTQVANHDAQARSEVMAVLETFKAQTRASRQLQQASQAQQQAVQRLVAEAEARTKDAHRQLRHAISEELDEVSRSQTKRQQQLMQMLTMLSQNV